MESNVSWSPSSRTHCSSAATLHSWTPASVLAKLLKPAAKLVNRVQVLTDELAELDDETSEITSEITSRVTDLGPHPAAVEPILCAGVDDNKL